MRKLSGESEMSSHVEVLTEFAGWIRDYCRHMSEEIAKGRQNIRSRATRLHIQQWVDTTLTFVAESTGVHCPSCGDLIPLNLDRKVVTDIIVSLLSDNQELSWKDVDFIKEKIKERADAHEIECKGHNRDCPIGISGFVILSDLLKSP
jgi:ribosomal protein S27E